MGSRELAASTADTVDYANSVTRIVPIVFFNPNALDLPLIDESTFKLYTRKGILVAAHACNMGISMISVRTIPFVCVIGQ